MVERIEDIKNKEIRDLFNFLCENVEEKTKTKKGKISKDKEGNEKIKRSIQLKEDVLDNTSLFTIEKNETGKNKEISANKIEINKEIARIILSKYKRNLEKTVIKKGYSIIDYDIEFELAKEQKMMKISKDNVYKLDKILKKINNFNDCSDNLDFENLDLYIIVINFQGRQVCFFEKFEKNMKLDKSRLMKFLSKENEKKFDTVNEDFLYLKYNLPCFLFDNNMYVLRKHTFEEIFDYCEKYKEICNNQQNINFISGLNVFDDIEKFKEELDTDNLNVLRKFSKVSKEQKYIQYLFRDFGEVNKLINEYKIYDLVVIENGKINVEKSNFQSILKLLNRDHVNHRLTKENFEANSKIKRS